MAEDYEQTRTSDEQAGEWTLVARRRRQRRRNGSTYDSDSDEADSSSESDEDAQDQRVADTSTTPKRYPPFNLDASDAARADPDDRVFQSVRAALSEYNCQSLVHFTDPTYASPIISRPTEYIDNESDVAKIGMKYRGKVVAELLFKLVRESGDITLLVQAHGSWLAFESRLKLKSPPIGNVRTGNAGTMQQSQWWANNRKHFLLFKLPLELREAIYGQIFSEELYPISWSHKDWPFGHGHLAFNPGRHVWQDPRRLDHTANIVPDPEIEGKSLSLTSKQVKHEITRFLSCHTRKCFDDPDYLHSYLFTYFTDLPGFSNLRRLELDFRHRDFITAFRVDLMPFRDHNHFGKRALLEELQCLSSTVQELTLRFHSPFTAKHDDPWGNTGELNGHRWFMDWYGRRDRYGFTTSCNKVITEWILVAAWDTVKHFSELRLTGAIKHSVKERWSLRHQRFRLSGDDIDLTADKEAISSWAGGAPRFACSTHCACDFYMSLSDYVDLSQEGHGWDLEQERGHIYRFDYED